MNKALSMSDPRFPDDFSLDDDLDFPASDTFVTETPRETYDPLNPPPSQLQSQPQIQQQAPQPQQPRALDPLESRFDEPAFTPAPPPSMQAAAAPVQPIQPQQPYVQAVPPVDAYQPDPPAPVQPPAPEPAATIEVMPGHARSQGQEVSTAIQFSQPHQAPFNPFG